MILYILVKGNASIPTEWKDPKFQVTKTFSSQVQKKSGVKPFKLPVATQGTKQHQI